MFELISLIVKFYSTTIVSNIIIIIGCYCFYEAMISIDTRSEVVSYLILGITIISITIINYIFYIKRSLRDYIQEIREENNKKALKIGEIIECICFSICVLAPIWRIPKFIEIFGNKKELIIELLKSFGICLAGLVLLFAINPLDIKKFLGITNESKESNDNMEKENNFEEDKVKKVENKISKETENKKDKNYKVVRKSSKKKNSTKKKKKITKKEKEKRQKIKKIVIKVILILLIIFFVFRIYNLIVLIKASQAIKQLKDKEEYFYSTNYYSDYYEVKTVIHDKENYSNNQFYSDSTYEINYNGENKQQHSGRILNFDSSDPFETNYTYIDDIAYKYYTTERDRIAIVNELGVDINCYDYLYEVEKNNNEKNIFGLVKNAFFYPAIKLKYFNNQLCYTLTNSGFITYYDYYTYKPVAWEIKKPDKDKTSNLLRTEYDFSEVDLDKETAYFLEKDYKNIEFIDPQDYTNYSDLEYPTVAISNTGLEPAQPLMENVELKDDETLNFLKLTGNSFGIKTIEVNNIETYEGFRTKYSNLREFTDEDFYYYHVFICYKEGQKLNYSSKITSSNDFSYNVQYLLTEEPTEKNTLLLIVLPRVEREKPCFVVDQKVKLINTVDAYNKAREKEVILRKRFNIPDVSLLSPDSENLAIITNDEIIADFEYYELAPIETVAWVINYTFSTSDEYRTGYIFNIKVYINATTGEFIGADYTFF